MIKLRWAGLVAILVTPIISSETSERPSVTMRRFKMILKMVVLSLSHYLLLPLLEAFDSKGIW